jgi:ubiquinone biosynthesis protein Coq4
MDTLSDIRAQAHHSDAQAFRADVIAARGGDSAARVRVSAVLIWTAFSCPDATQAVYDNLASAWLGRGRQPAIPADLPQAPLEDSFWAEFLSVIEAERVESDATRITVGVAALGAAVHESFGEIAENHAQNHPGARAAQFNPLPGRTDLEVLGKCPEGSLGKTLYKMVVENGYDLEVLDREAIGLSELPKSLAYLNTRILQMHDVWHLVAGYQTTGTHEVAISAFQLAQFGHNYSSMFLATVSAVTILLKPRGFSLLMQLTSEAWQHGRETPAMMDIAWEQEWEKTLPEIRQQHGIPTYSSILPATLLEVAEGNSGKVQSMLVVLRILFLRFSGAFPA